MTRVNQTHDRLGIKVNIGINEQEVGRLGLLHEARDGQVTGSVHERLVLGRVEHHLDTALRTQTLETKHGLCIGRETNATVTRGANEEYDGLTHYKRLGQGF